MIEQVKIALVHAGASWVLWILAGLSVLSVTVMLDRLLVFRAQRDNMAALAGELHRLLAKWDVEAARTRLSKSPSAAAAVVLAGLARWQDGTDAAKEAMLAAAGLQRARLERRLMFLGTVGNNAPFIGLLGTVIGVVGAFEALGTVTTKVAASQLAPERVMSTISEALVATAVGLVVAIPAVAVFNYFQGLLTSTLNDADTLGHVLLSHMGSGAPTCSEPRNPPKEREDTLAHPDLVQESQTN